MVVSKEDIKNKCIEVFKKYGWSVERDHVLLYENSGSLSVDFALIGEITQQFDFEDIDQTYQLEWSYKTEGICGYVLVLHPENKEDVKEIKEKLNILLTRVKPKVLFVTDGNVFETYFNGVYYDTLMVPLKAENLEQSIRVHMYAKKLIEQRKDI